uniref:Protein-serine/threonine kinase n=1 Tax=Wollemia nobilis TaxID=56998 RepID=A0A0C9S0X8_9CONI
MAMRKLAEAFSRSVVEDIERCSSMKQTGVSLKYMMAFGSKPTAKNLLYAAQFLHKELPIRLAHRVMELVNLPYGLSSKPPVLTVRDWYVESFRELRSFPAVRDTSDELNFTEMIGQIKTRHNNVVPTMAMGVQHLKQDLGHKIVLNELPEIHQILDRVYMSRIGIRMLIGQHVALHEPDPPPGYIGLICTKTSPVTVAQKAIDDARAICTRSYGRAPKAHVYGDPNFTFAYVPIHLNLMVFELVKNSLRAVQECFMGIKQEIPPIRVVIADGDEDVTIKISDEGGGIPRSGLPKIFTYLYSTAESPTEGVSMAGYGYGLPISRLYARYFGGDLQVISMEGYGVKSNMVSEWI